MSPTTRTALQGAQFAPYEPVSSHASPILVASDTSSQSDAAFSLALSIANRTNRAVHIVSTIRPYALPMYPFDAVSVNMDIDQATRAGREGVLAAQRARLVSPTATWPLIVRTGEPAREIVECARELNASVIVMGRGRHAALERAFGGETVLRVLQLGDTPVLATEARLTELPKRVVIGVDFSEFSLYAAEVAMSFIAHDAHVTLLHVAPPFAETDPVLQERAVAYRNQARHGFEQLRSHLARHHVTFEDVVVTGNPSDEIIRSIRATDAELVVTATHGYGFLRRLILGSVAAELVRHAPCSVLAVPGSARTLMALRLRAGSEERTRVFGIDVYDAELHAFSERHPGRRCTIEIDDPQLGAQILGYGLPLVGATYDRADRSVTLMCGAGESDGQHLSHRILNVTAIDLLVDEAGRDHALRVAHGNGQTLVLLE